ncbi:MAG: PQQ-like beta-propeller repeat protein [Planctomycetes bacterium]|nr:PQQ-like beta-propeller repeat protein [Planctomycetota bacterium]
MRMFSQVSLFALTLALTTAFTNAGGPIKTGDWPQWRGPNRDAVSAETGLLKAWPKAGPTLLWDSRKVNGGASVGAGYSSLAITKGRIFTMGDRSVAKSIDVIKGKKKGKKTVRDGSDFVFCLDAQTGKEIWKSKVGPAQGDGPRCTPTVDGDRVYALTRQGILACLKVADGAILWQKHLKNDFKGYMMSGWDYSESPTIDGDKLICTPGGKEAAMVALNKLTGDVYWKCQAPTGAGAGYASVVKTEVGGVKQYITLMGPQLGVIGVDAETGKFLWNYKRIANGTANIPTPIVKGEFVFASTGYRQGGSALLKLVPTGDGGIKVEEKYYYNNQELQNHHGGMVMLGDHIYGGHGHNEGFPFCLEWKTGKLTWGDPDRGPGGGSAAVLYADGRLYFRYQSGDVALIEANPKALNVISRFRPQIGGNGWPHPVIYQGRLYLRGNDQILCFDIKAK